MWKALNFRIGIPPFHEVFFQTPSSAILAVGSQETDTGYYPPKDRDTQERMTECDATDLHPPQV